MHQYSVKIQLEKANQSDNFYFGGSKNINPIRWNSKST